VLEPGTRDVQLAPGVYALRTLRDAELAVVSGGVTTSISVHDKEIPPDFQVSILRGEAPRGRVPRTMRRNRSNQAKSRSTFHRWR